jgi:hypothetical protein
MVALGRRPGIVCTLADLRSMALRLTHDLLPTGFQADPIKISRSTASALFRSILDARKFACAHRWEMVARGILTAPFPARLPD